MEVGAGVGERHPSDAGQVGWPWLTRPSGSVGSVAEAEDGHGGSRADHETGAAPDICTHSSPAGCCYCNLVPGSRETVFGRSKVTILGGMILGSVEEWCWPSSQCMNLLAVVQACGLHKLFAVFVITGLQAASEATRPGDTGATHSLFCRI